jgi:hypothetical protein
MRGGVGDGIVFAGIEAVLFIAAPVLRILPLAEGFRERVNGE